jgi:hypothetical protein
MNCRNNVIVSSDVLELLGNRIAERELEGLNTVPPIWETSRMN